MTLDSPAPDSISPVPGLLVVDDDPAVRKLLHLIAARQGFRVWTADSGLAAVELYRQEQARISLVLLDVRMPGLDGPQTLAELRRIHPGVRCCFMSGNTDPHTIDDLLTIGGLRCFAKPFQIEELAADLWQLARSGQRQSA